MLAALGWCRAQIRVEVLASPAFIAALALLALNDSFLKHAHPGLLTGKLSDFAGLFALSVIWTAILPDRRGVGFIAITLVFAWWKSALSQPAIDVWSLYGPYRVGRVVDATDLIALLVVPAGLWYGCARRRRRRPRHGFLGGGLMAVSAAVFLASFGSFGESQYTYYRPANNDASATYPLPFAPAEFSTRLDATGLFHQAHAGLLAEPETGWYDVTIDNDCRTAVVEVTPLFNGTAMRLDSLGIAKRCGKSNERDLRRLFEKELMARLSGERTDPARPTTVKGQSFDYAPGDAPTVLLAGTMEDFARRLDAKPLFGHEYHDGVYQLGSTSCYGRMRAEEQPDHARVVVTGIGFALPCFKGASQECLAVVFETFIRLPGDPPSTSGLTPSPDNLACLSTPEPTVGSPTP